MQVERKHLEAMRLLQELRVQGRQKWSEAATCRLGRWFVLVYKILSVVKLCRREARASSRHVIERASRMMMHEVPMPEGAERERGAEAEREAETESCKRTQKKVLLRQLNISASEGNDERPVSGQADLKVLPSLGNTRSPVGAGNGPARTAGFIVHI